MGLRKTWILVEIPQKGGKGVRHYSQGLSGRGMGSPYTSSIPGIGTGGSPLKPNTKCSGGTFLWPMRNIT